ncbi:hypothetical protein ACVXHA_29660 [Escherichia coli]
MAEVVEAPYRFRTATGSGETTHPEVIAAAVTEQPPVIPSLMLP